MVHARPKAWKGAIYAALAGLFLLAGCVTEEKEPESKLEYLNGEKYKANSPVSVGPVPVATSIERASKATTITGKVVVGEDALYKRPVRYERIELVRAGSVVATTSTDEDGSFTIMAELPNGSYELRLVSKTWRGSRPITLKGYELKDVELSASKQENP